MVGSANSMDLDGFLGHSNTTGNVKNLKSWKKDGHIDIWLHTRAPIVALWQASWPKIVERDKDGTKTVEVWSGTFNSWESEIVLQNQYKRHDDGTRQMAPEVCPIAILLETIRQAVESGEMAWDQELFHFEGDDPKKALTLRAAPMFNGVKKELWETLSDSERSQAKAGGYGMKDAWKQNCMPKCNYVFSVGNNAKPADGCMVTTETTLVGDRVKKVIRDAMTSLGDEKGNPLKSPYAIRLEYNPTTNKIDEKYSAIKMDKFPLTDAIREIICEKDPPSISHLIGPGDVSQLRASMEAAYCGPDGAIDFDEIFRAAEALAGIDPSESAESAVDAIVNHDVKPAPKATPKSQAKPVPKPVDDRYTIHMSKDDGSSFAADGVELFACDSCGGLVRDDDTVCHHCGFSFVDDEPEPEPEPKPAPKPRSRGAKGKPAQDAVKRDKVGF